MSGLDGKSAGASSRPLRRGPCCPATSHCPGNTFDRHVPFKFPDAMTFLNICTVPGAALPYNPITTFPRDSGFSHNIVLSPSLRSLRTPSGQSPKSKNTASVTVVKFPAEAAEHSGSSNDCSAWHGGATLPARLIERPRVVNAWRRECVSTCCWRCSKLQTVAMGGRRVHLLVFNRVIARRLNLTLSNSFKLARVLMQKEHLCSVRFVASTL